MRWVTSQGGKLQIGEATTAPLPEVTRRPLRLEPGHVHELLSAGRPPATVAAWIAATHADGKSVVWCDVDEPPYPPALAALGVPPSRFYAARPLSAKSLLWVASEAARCTGVGVTVVRVSTLRTVEARRLQLSAERGGGMLLVLRDSAPGAVHAARTRWLVEPAAGEQTVRRWRMTLQHDRSGRTADTLLLEHDRETHQVRLADAPPIIFMAAARG